MKPLPRCHERSAREFAAVLRAAGCRSLTPESVERGFRWWWGIECGKQAQTAKAISKRVVAIMEENGHGDYIQKNEVSNT